MRRRKDETTIVEGAGEASTIEGRVTQIRREIENIVRVATEAPLKQFAISAGLEAGVVSHKVAELPAGHGLNAAGGRG